MAKELRNVRFSNRPFGVKHFQTIRRCGVDVTHGLTGVAQPICTAVTAITRHRAADSVDHAGGMPR